MNTSAPANYVIRIDGHLGEHCSASLVGMSIIRDSDGTTTIAGPVAPAFGVSGFDTSSKCHGKRSATVPRRSDAVEPSDGESPQTMNVCSVSSVCWLDSSWPLVWVISHSFG